MQNLKQSLQVLSCVCGGRLIFNLKALLSETPLSVGLIKSSWWLVGMGVPPGLATLVPPSILPSVPPTRLPK